MLSTPWSVLRRGPGAERTLREFMVDAERVPSRSLQAGLAKGQKSESLGRQEVQVRLASSAKSHGRGRKPPRAARGPGVLYFNSGIYFLE